MIPETTRQRVIQTAVEMGYRTNRAARALAGAKTNVLALWITLLSPHHLRVIQHLQREVRTHRYELMFSEVDRHTAWEQQHINPSDWPSDGIFTYSTGDWLQTYLKQYPPPSVPMVYMGLDPVEGIDYVVHDIYKVARQAVEHLIRSGRKRVAFVYSLDNKGENEDRHRAYQDAVNEAGLQPEYILCLDVTRAGVRKTFREYVTAHGHPRAIFCKNDDAAIGALRAIHDLGLRCPDDIAIIGFDGLEDTEFHYPPISTCVAPIEEMCKTSCEFMGRRMKDPMIPQQQAVLEYRLVLRESSG